MLICLPGALQDAAIAAWNLKYDALFWRPITAIRLVARLA
jgi:hypothetical protein